MITRDFLLHADCKTAFGAIDETLLWSSQQRMASLRTILSQRPDDSPVWMFGYGSLMWNPAFEYVESAAATLHGWHRDFCLRLIAGRATQTHPGRMLALRAGGITRGIAFKLPESGLDAELSLIWKREMITACYLPIWSKVSLDDGTQVNALTFIINPQHPWFEGDSRPEMIAPLIAAAEGPIGSNAQYVFSLEQAMKTQGIDELAITELANCVRHTLGQHATPESDSVSRSK